MTVRVGTRLAAQILFREAHTGEVHVPACALVVTET